MNSDERNIILKEISEIKQKISSLKQRQEKEESILLSLHKRLSELDKKQTTSSSSPTQISPTDKISLFRGLFKGREDVFPKLWENTKSGKKGYSPTCSNEWVRGVCQKPRIKCGECPNQAFVSVSDEAILNHLQGKHVIGVYPLLPDDTCLFLAADFDKDSWKDDVLAFTETCRAHSIPYAIERSRSGNGAHVWFFFSTPVPASTARKMGSFLITETMSRRHELSMSSYDRLFPNQDTLPNGGFGNLIALPLQHRPRQESNTVFLDEDLQPLADQWLFLKTIRRLSISEINRIVSKATTQGQVLGVQFATTDDESDDTPWIRTALNKKIEINPESIPGEVTAVLSQRLYIEKKDLPSPLINQLMRLAAFQNPEFYKKQNLRLSTALTPRVISCAEEHKQHVSLPRGNLDEAQSLLSDYASKLAIDDKRNSAKSIEAKFKGELTTLQMQAADSVLKHENGIVVAPPGFGKTVLGTYLIGQRKCNTLVLVHRQPLLDQWRSQIGVFLDKNPKSIGQLGGGKRKLTGDIDVAMIQSLSRKESVDDLVADYGQVIIDECHHLPAVSFERVLSEVNARYIVGLTATPQRRDGHQPIIHMQIGPVRYKVDPRKHSAKRPFEHRVVIRNTDFDLSPFNTKPSIQELYSQLVLDKQRNDLIVDDILSAMEEGRSPILLTERKDHLELLHKRLQGFVKNIVILHGGRSKKERETVQGQLASIPDTEERLLLATGKFIGEGFDDARLDTLFLALPVSWKGTLVQYSGRLHRLHPDKSEVRIIDYVDHLIPMLAKMHEKRKVGYRAMGYEEIVSNSSFELE